MSDFAGGGASAGGLRERKRRETLQRITDVAVGLFIAKGYGATTLDEIAAAADISRRTFFHYFKSKDDILLSMQSGMGEMLAAGLAEQSHDKSPFEAMRDAAVKIGAPYPAEEIIALDQLMRSSETVQARKQASYAHHEQTVFDALRERWPDPKRETGLRLVAMLTIGAIRLAIDKLTQEGGKRPFTELLEESFEALRLEI